MRYIRAALIQCVHYRKQRCGISRGRLGQGENHQLLVEAATEAGQPTVKFKAQF